MYCTNLFISKMKNKIILEAETELKDNGLRSVVSSLITKIETINERTKRQTIQIKELGKLLNEVKK